VLAARQDLAGKWVRTGQDHALDCEVLQWFLMRKELARAVRASMPKKQRLAKRGASGGTMRARRRGSGRPEVF
jgi:hypothetical protein